MNGNKKWSYDFIKNINSYICLDLNKFIHIHEFTQFIYMYLCNMNSYIKRSYEFIVYLKFMDELNSTDQMNLWLKSYEDMNTEILN